MTEILKACKSGGISPAVLGRNGSAIRQDVLSVFQMMLHSGAVTRSDSIARAAVLTGRG